MSHRKFIVRQTASGPREPGVYKHKEFYWHAVSAGRVVAWSGESYNRQSHALRMARSFAKAEDSVWVEKDGKLVRDVQLNANVTVNIVSAPAV